MFCDKIFFLSPTVHVHELAEAPSTLRRGNLKTQLYFYGYVGLPSTLIRHENRAFQSCSSNGSRIWKRRLYVLVWTKNTLKAELFENDDETIIMLLNSLPEFSSDTALNDRCRIVAFSNFSGEVSTENIWCVFQSQNTFFNFLRRSVDPAACITDWKNGKLTLHCVSSVENV